MLKSQKNSKMKGTVGIGSAIQYFTLQGHIVSIPINDSQGYDLIVDIRNSLGRVSVKTTARLTKYNTWEVALRTTGGNQSFHTAKLFDKTSCDFVFVLTDVGRRWLIPAKEIDVVSSMNLGKKQYAEFELA